MGVLDPLINAPRQQKLIFGAMLLVIVGALGYFFLISGSRAERDALLEENEVRRAEVLKARADEANLRPFRVRAEVLRKQLEQAKERLPSEREIPQVYRQVSDLAAQSGLGVSLFQPKAAEDRDVLSEVPIAVTAECTYHQLGAFLERVGKMPRIVSLGEFRLIGIDKPTGTVRAEMTLATYTFKAEGAPPPPAKPGAPAPSPPAKPAPPAQPPGAAAPPAPPAPAAPAPPAQPR
jgi:type IV pilus assembly protein PilO